MASTTEYIEFLDELRESGVTNMFGAAPYLAGRFAIDKALARRILSKWMELDLDIPAPIRAAHVNKTIPELTS